MIHAKIIQHFNGLTKIGSAPRPWLIEVREIVIIDVWIQNVICKIDHSL